MKILHECRVTHVLYVIWEVEFDGDTHFYIQGHVKARSKRLNFETQIFILKTKPYCPVLSQDSKNDNRVDVRQLQMPNSAFQKVTLSPLPGFGAIEHLKIKALA